MRLDAYPRGGCGMIAGINAESFHMPSREGNAVGILRAAGGICIPENVNCGALETVRGVVSGGNDIMPPVASGAGVAAF